MSTEARPTGTVTMLFTDIEGSTRLLQELGDRYGEVLAAHRRLLRESWAEHRGTEIGTEGDSFFVVFARASDAVNAAARSQQLLSDHPWPDDRAVRVRMGMHTGEPTLRGDDYEGIDVHRGARIAAAGHGGQVLLSQATVELLPADLPNGLRIRDLGAHTLKDLPDPQHLFQLVIDGLESRFPDLRSTTPTRTNLPTPPTPLLGRERELEETRSILGRDDVRLLTLTGPGGTGKTRLAIELAATMLEAFADGAYLVNLEPLVDPDLVLPAIAGTVPLGERPGEPLGGWLQGRLQTRDVLIILDNFEHVVDAAPAVAELLARTEGPTFIVTSREALHLAGEHAYPVPPLELPVGVGAGRDATSSCASVALFVDRARAMRPDFELTEENSAAVADICVRLDGLPLAIELAAPWLRMMEPATLRDKLGERLDLFVDGARDLPERQRTLRGAIDWSYRLLSETEAAVFNRLGIFAGGWTIEAAEAVCGSIVGGTELILTMGALVDKNLTRRSPNSQGGTRFAMLESIRRFALEQLEATGDLGEASRRHAETYLALAEEAEPELFGPRQSIWTSRLGVDVDNLRAAMTWATETPEGAEIGMRLAGSLMFFWFFRGEYREGLDRSERMLEVAADASPAARAKGLLAAGGLAVLVGEHGRARSLLDEGVLLGRSLGDRSCVARCLDWLGLLALFRDDVDTARRLLEESVTEARAVDDRWSLADALGTLGTILPLQGAFEAALVISTEALEIASQAEDVQGLRMALFGRALAGYRSGDLPSARAAIAEGLSISRSIFDSWFIAYFLWLDALVAVESGDLETAERSAAESLTVARTVEAPLLIVCALEASAAALHMAGKPTDALAILEEARDLAEAGGVPASYMSAVERSLGQLAHEDGDLDASSRLFESALQTARAIGDPWAESRALLGQAQASTGVDLPRARDQVTQALRLQLGMGAKLGVAEALEICGCMDSEEGEFHQAALVLAAAGALRDSLGSVRSDQGTRRCEQALRVAKEGLGSEVFADAVAAGRDAGWERAASAALDRLISEA